MDAVVHACILFYFPYFELRKDVGFPNGHNAGMWYLGLVTNCCVIVVVTLKVALETKYWPWFIAPMLILSVASWFASAWVFSLWTTLAPEVAGIVPYMLRSYSFWFIIPLIGVAAMIKSYTTKAYINIYMPNKSHIVREKQVNEVKETRTSSDLEKGLLEKKAHTDSSGDIDQVPKLSRVESYSGYAFSASDPWISKNISQLRGGKNARVVRPRTAVGKKK